jgi:hypothetical protein
MADVLNRGQRQLFFNKFLFDEDGRSLGGVVEHGIQGRGARAKV